MVELTKRFYVEKKAEQIAEKLEKLAEKQDKLAESKDNDAQKQDEINKEFDKMQEEMRELDKQNKDLKKPMDVPVDEQKEKSIEEDMKKAAEELNKPGADKDKQGKAKPKQKSAADKMKQMGAQMQMEMEGGESEQLEEDVKMLRQILDNLLAYSFSQEEVMGQFRGSSTRAANFAKYLKKQQDLKLQFNHVDDSLFAMSLRNPKITEEITKEVGNVHYYVDKALADLADNVVPRGVSNQQYAITASNKLADFLSDLLNNMQMQMSASGSGKGKGKSQGDDVQLSDIIKKQEGLAKKMQEGMKKGEKPGQGKEKGEGQGEGEGKDGKGQKSGGKEKGGKSGQGEGEGGDGEGNAGELLEIYKEQQMLREQLQQMLNKQGMGGNGQAASRQMKEIEKQLLNKGFRNETMQKMQNLKQELLKLDKAMQQQGEESKRQSQTNKKEFNNTANQLPDALKEYLNSVEILNRQTLPLRPNFNQKVQIYFKKND